MYVAPVFEGQERPVFYESESGPWTTTHSNGTSSSGCSLAPGWGPTVHLANSGSDWGTGIKIKEIPEYYAVSLYLNGQYYAKLSLQLQEGEK